MVRLPRVSAETGALLCGVLIILAAWAMNLQGVLSGQESAAHDSSDLYVWLSFMLQGIGVAAVGVVYANYRVLLQDSTLSKRYAVALLLITDGGLHLLALNQHVVESPISAAFFAVVSPLQILAGMLLPHLPRRLDMLWLLLTAFLIAAFVVTRLFAVWPTGVVEEVDPLGVLSKLVELLTLGLLVSLMRADRAGTARGHAGPSPNGP